MDQEAAAFAISNTKRLIEGAYVLGLPVFVTEQYPKGLGPTVPELMATIGDRPHVKVEKTSFAATGEPTFLAALAETHRHQVILCGMETHVCVWQTAIDLRGEGYGVVLADDAVASRTKRNRRSGISAMRDAGVTVLSTEAILFRLLRVAGTPEFKAISGLVK